MKINKKKLNKIIKNAFINQANKINYEGKNIMKLSKEDLKEMIKDEIKSINEITDETTYKLKIDNHDVSFNKSDNTFSIDNIKMTINDFEKILRFAKKNGIIR